MTLANTQRCIDIKYLITGLRNEISRIQRTLDDPERVEKEISRLEADIVRTRQQINVRKIALSDGPTEIERLHDRICQLAQDLKQAEYAKKIEQLQALQADINSLKEGMEPEDSDVDSDVDDDLEPDDPDFSDIESLVDRLGE